MTLWNTGLGGLMMRKTTTKNSLHKSEKSPLDMAAKAATMRGEHMIARIFADANFKEDKAMGIWAIRDRSLGEYGMICVPGAKLEDWV